MLTAATRKFGGHARFNLSFDSPKWREGQLAATHAVHGRLPVAGEVSGRRAPAGGRAGAGQQSTGQTS
jgi:hypothetical protein